MAKVHSIQTLDDHGWAQRRVARELASHRETVASHVRIAAGRPLVATRRAPTTRTKTSQTRPPGRTSVAGEYVFTYDTNGNVGHGGRRHFVSAE